jgi:AAA+ superfamily predicted ATPase
VSPIHVLVAVTSPDMKAELVSAAVNHNVDMVLVSSRVVQTKEIDSALAVIPASEPCALVVVGRPGETEQIVTYWVDRRKDLVALGVDIVDDLVRIAVRDPGLEPLFTAVRNLVNSAGLSPSERISRLQLPRVAALDSEHEKIVLKERPLLTAAIIWIHALLRKAAGRLLDSRSDQTSITMTTAAVADFLDPRGPCTTLIEDFGTADEALSQALAKTDAQTDPLAHLVVALGLNPLEFRVVLLSLAPELDARYQRWIGLLMDDLTRRCGTLALFAELLGEPAEVRSRLATSGRLAKWRVFDCGVPHGDEPLRLDPPLRGWLLGEDNALRADPRVRSVLRTCAWLGAALIEPERTHAIKLIAALKAFAEAPWRVLACSHPATWKALIELGAAAGGQNPVRTDLAGVRGLNAIEIEEAAIRLARLARLSGDLLVIDASAEARDIDEAARMFLGTIGMTGTPAAVIATDVARVVRLLSPSTYTIEREDVPASVRVAALHAAAVKADAPLSRDAADSLAARYPFQIDNLEHAARIAQSSLPASGGTRQDHFLTSLRQVIADGSSDLARRIEPMFKLDDVVLPPDRKRQLEEVVDNVRFATKVLDGWNFRAQLPYGRGVTALFHGPSGTGKTMAALAVAQKLGVEILHVDLSRVMSKFIGDTEKHIDEVFHAAESSGAALLIDEAEALLGKRSEVNDAHDRYANIEVAYLLQRMEAFEGLAILTTNLRQNVDTAFLRRLRFIIDFPKPDVAAREEIWRRCLPTESHELDDVTFRQLARRIELTGGHVRQITLRAAFVAAAAGTRITLAHVAHACRAEFAKLGLPPVELEERRRAA